MTLWHWSSTCFPVYDMAPQAIDSSNARSCNYALLVAGQSPSLWRTETENGGWWWFTIRHDCHFNSSLTEMCWGPLNFRSKSYIYNDTADEKRMIKMRIKRATDNKSQCSVARGRKEVTNGQLASLGIRMWWQSVMVEGVMMLMVAVVMVRMMMIINQSRD